VTEALNLNRLVYFAAVVDAGSFTRAAERLGITKTVVSQQVARLEAEVGASLLVRTTRRVQPTEAGRRLHSRTVTILREAGDAYSELAQATAAPRGMLRITAPNDYGTSVVAPVVAAFAACYPACGVELMLADAKVDLLSQQLDLSIRVGWLEDSSVQARRIGAFQQLLVAASSVLRRYPMADPSNLTQWPFIANTALKEPLQWQFSRGSRERRTVRTQATISVNATPAALAATLAGGGASILPDFLVAEDLQAGRLSRVFPEWSLPAGGIHAVYPAARFRPPKVTAFVEMLAEHEKRRSQHLRAPRRKP
jgi:DNA-binding transcriptional LysR family regulator